MFQYAKKPQSGSKSSFTPPVPKKTVKQTAPMPDWSPEFQQHALDHSPLVQAARRLNAASASQPLPNPLRQRMETAFGSDFSGVRVHPNSQSVTDADAYTRGHDMHFATGEYQPNTPEGQALIGHELTHVVQQDRGGAAHVAQTKSDRLNSDPRLEQEADTLGEQAAAGQRVQVMGSVSSPSPEQGVVQGGKRKGDKEKKEKRAPKKQKMAPSSQISDQQTPFNQLRFDSETGMAKPDGNITTEDLERLIDIIVSYAKEDDISIARQILSTIKQYSADTTALSVYREADRRINLLHSQNLLQNDPMDTENEEEERESEYKEGREGKADEGEKNKIQEIQHVQHQDDQSKLNDISHLFPNCNDIIGDGVDGKIEDGGKVIMFKRTKTTSSKSSKKKQSQSQDTQSTVTTEEEWNSAGLVNRFTLNTERSMQGNVQPNQLGKTIYLESNKEEVKNIGKDKEIKNKFPVGYLATVPLPLNINNEKGDKSATELYQMYQGAFHGNGIHQLRLMLGINIADVVEEDGMAKGGTEENIKKLKTKLEEEMSKVKLNSTYIPGQVSIVGHLLQPPIIDKFDKQPKSPDYVRKVVDMTPNPKFTYKPGFPFSAARHDLITDDLAKLHIENLKKYNERVFIHTGDNDLVSLKPNEENSIFENFSSYIEDYYKGRDLYLMPELPEIDSSYEDSYVWIKGKQQLYYIRQNKAEPVKIHHVESFKSVIKQNNKETKQHLTPQEVKDYITSNGGHIPQEKPQLARLGGAYAFHELDVRNFARKKAEKRSKTKNLTIDTLSLEKSIYLSLLVNKVDQQFRAIMGMGQETTAWFAEPNTLINASFLEGQKSIAYSLRQEAATALKYPDYAVPLHEAVQNYAKNESSEKPRSIFLGEQQYQLVTSSRKDIVMFDEFGRGNSKKDAAGFFKWVSNSKVGRNLQFRERQMKHLWRIAYSVNDNQEIIQFIKKKNRPSLVKLFGDDYSIDNTSTRTRGGEKNNENEALKLEYIEYIRKNPETLENDENFKKWNKSKNKDRKKGENFSESDESKKVIEAYVEYIKSMRSITHEYFKNNENFQIWQKKQRQEREKQGQKRKMQEVEDSKKSLSNKESTLTKDKEIEYKLDLFDTLMNLAFDAYDKIIAIEKSDETEQSYTGIDEVIKAFKKIDESTN